MKFALVIISFLLLSHQLTGQVSYNEKMTVQASQEDFHLFKKMITTIHPNLYLYTPKNEWDAKLIS